MVSWDQVVLRQARRARAPKPSRRSASPLTPVERLFTQPISLNLWRAPVDNDGFKLTIDLSKQVRGLGPALGSWMLAGVHTRPPEELVQHSVERVVGADQSVTYHHTVQVPADLADLPRVGVMFQLPSSFSEVRWYGCGPHENYPDRKSSAMREVWQQPIDSSPYLVPQEFGLRTDCGWFECIDKRSRVVRVESVGDSLVHFSATRHTPAQLFEARHDSELVRNSDLVVCVDTAHRGLGTASCGPDVLAQYRLTPGTYRFSYKLSMFSPT